MKIQDHHAGGVAGAAASLPRAKGGESAAPQRSAAACDSLRLSDRSREIQRARSTALGAVIPSREIPAYPIAYDAGKALNAAGKAGGEPGFGAQWAGQGAPLARSLPAAELVAALAAEMKAA